MKPLSLFDVEADTQTRSAEESAAMRENTSTASGLRGMETAMPLEPRGWASQFEITNAQSLDVRYRLLRVENLPASDDLDRLLNKLAKTVNYELRQPVVLLRKKDAPYLAVPQETPAPASSEYGIGPHIARLVAATENVRLDLNALENEEEAAIAVKFLEAAFRTPLIKRNDLWRVGGNGFYTKNSRNRTDPAAEVDLYPGFAYSVTVEEGRLFLSVDVNVRCIDRKFLPERIAQGQATDYKRKHCLYLLGNRWYMVQLWGTTGSDIRTQQFRKEGEEQTWDIYNYTLDECRKQTSEGTLPPWIAQLDPEDAAITYRYPGSEVERYGALALCRLSRATSDRDVARLHRASIFDPTPRMELAQRMVRTYFQRSALEGQDLRLSIEPFRPLRRVFAVPDQVFGNNRVLRVAAEGKGSRNGSELHRKAQSAETPAPVEVVSLQQMGRRRLELITDTAAGPFTRSPFDPQYMLVPMSLARETSEEYEARFLPAMRRTAGNASYAMTRILYDDRNATTLDKQVRAIRQALEKKDARSGYGLLILPMRARPQLHDMLKTELWPDFQFQCASAAAIARYYERPGVVRRDSVNKLNSYVQNCALGLLVVNRKWGWALAKPLHYEVYIGVDVLNQTAGFTFVFNGGRQIYFSDARCKQKERLLAKEMQKVLVDHLTDHLTALGLRPKSLVLHRDGRTFESEKKGVAAAIQELIRRGLLDHDVRVGIVDIRKTSSDAIRLYEGEHLQALENPQIGTYRVRSRRTGLVCTTGKPFRFPGTAKPLTATIASGELDIEWVLEDIFALSLGVFTAPDKCARLPLTIKLADDLLEPIASYIEDEAEIDEEDAEEMEAEVEETWSDASRQ